MNIAIVGASGFVGKNLINYLLINTNYNILAISHHIENITIPEEYVDRVKIIKADVLDFEEINKELKGIDVVYYLVHMMADNKSNFKDKEILAAENINKAIKFNNIKRIIYLGGLGNDKDKLSKHLISRHQTGNILRRDTVGVIELRASMIIGEGSISFEIVRNLVNKARLIILPKWSKTKTQPIGLSDILLYLKNSADLKINHNEIIEVGGKETMSYQDFIKKYVKFKKKNILIFRLPMLPSEIAGLFLGIYNSKKQTRVGQCMIGSFKNEMIITNDNAQKLFPNIIPQRIEEFFI